MFYFPANTTKLKEIKNIRFISPIWPSRWPQRFSLSYSNLNWPFEQLCNLFTNSWLASSQLDHINTCPVFTHHTPAQSPVFILTTLLNDGLNNPMRAQKSCRHIHIAGNTVWLPWRRRGLITGLESILNVSGSLLNQLICIQTHVWMLMNSWVW